MLIETATVTGISADKVQLGTSRKSSCGSCKMKQGCGQYLLMSDSSALELDLSVSRGPCAADLHLGSTVQLELKPGSMLTLTAWFYLLPLFMLLIATAIGSLAQFPEGWILLLSIMGLIAGMGISRIGLRKVANLHQPVLSVVKPVQPLDVVIPTDPTPATAETSPI